MQQGECFVVCTCEDTEHCEYGHCSAQWKLWITALQIEVLMLRQEVPHSTRSGVGSCITFCVKVSDLLPAFLLSICAFSKHTGEKLDSASTWPEHEAWEMSLLVADRQQTECLNGFAVCLLAMDQKYQLRTTPTSYDSWHWHCSLMHKGLFAPWNQVEQLWSKSGKSSVMHGFGSTGLKICVCILHHAHHCSTAPLLLVCHRCVCAPGADVCNVFFSKLVVC